MDTASLKIAVNTSDVKTANDDLNKLSKTSGNTEKATNQLTRSYASLSNILSTIGIAALTHEFIKIADEMKLLDSRLKMVSSSTAEYAAQKKELLAISKETYSSIAEITTLYTKLDPALKSLGATTKDVNNITESFAKGLKLGGANAGEAASATLQFAQAMGSGVLRGEEFNAIAEASPKLMKYLAEGLGVPQTALRQMAMEGELTAGRVSGALLKMTTKINEDFTQIPLTVGMATTNIKTDLMVAIEEFDKTTGATKALAETIAGMSVDLKQYGTDITAFFVSTSKFINDHNTALKTTATLVGGVATAYYGFIAGGAVITGIRGITTSIYGLRAAMIALQASSPILLGISVALGVATAAYIAHDDALEKKNYSTINSIEALTKSHNDLLKKRKEIQSDKFALDKTQKKETAIVDAELKKIENRLNDIGTARSNNVDKAKKEAEEVQKSAKALEENSKKIVTTTKTKAKKGKTDEEKLNEDIKKSKIDALEHNAEVEKDLLVSIYQSELDAIEYNAERRKELAIEIFESTRTEIERLNDEVINKYNLANEMFPDGIPQEWFDKINKQYEDLNNNIKDQFDDPIIIKIEGFDDISKHTSTILNSMVDMRKEADRYTKVQETIKSNDISITAFRSKKSRSSIAEDKKSSKASSDSTKEQIANFSDIAGAFAGLMEENSREQKAAQSIQMALNTTLMISNALTAISGASIGAGPTGLITGAAMLTFLTANGIFKSSSQSLTNNSFSDMTENTGTGTVLGDTTAQSKSIEKSLEIMGDLAKPEFALTSQMAKSLNSIDQKIGGVTSILLRTGGFELGKGFNQMWEFKPSFGQDIVSQSSARWDKAFSTLGTGIGIIDTWAENSLKLGSGFFLSNALAEGIFGGGTSIGSVMTDYGIQFNDQLFKSAIKSINASSYQTALTVISSDGGWFGDDSTSMFYSTIFNGLSDEVNSQFSSILSDLYRTTILAGDALDTASSKIDSNLSNFIISIGKISLEGKTGDQIQEQLSNVFGAVGDNIAKSAFPLLSSFQKVGEGLFETMTRVAGGMDQAEYYINRLGKSFNDIVYSDLINKQGDVAVEALRQSILGLEGTSNGISQIIQSMTGSIEDLYGTYTSLDLLRFDLSAIGTSTDALTSSMLYGAGGIGLLSDATQNYIENYLNESEQVAYNTAVMTDKFKDLGLLIPTTKQGFTDLLKSIDVTTESGQDLYGRLILLSDGFNTLTESSDKIKSSLFDKIRSFIDSISGKSSLDAPKTFSDFSASFNTMIDAIANGSSNLEQIGQTTLDNAKMYLDTVTATAMSGRDIEFAKAMLINKFSGVIATPDATLSTINDTLRFSLGESGAISSQLKELKEQVRYLNDLNTTNTATNLKILSTQRSILGETATA